MSERPGRPRLTRVGFALVGLACLVAIVAAVVAGTQPAAGGPAYLIVIACIVAACAMVIVGVVAWLSGRSPTDRDSAGEVRLELVDDAPQQPSESEHPAVKQDHQPVIAADEAQGYGWLRASDLVDRPESHP